MSEQAKDGGPAFPAKRWEQIPDANKIRAWDPDRPAPFEEVQYPGMSLRDYFAAQALQQAIQHERERRAGTINPGNFRYEEIAHAAYVIADAMLAERIK